MSSNISRTSEFHTGLILGVGQGPLRHDFRGAQRVPPMHQMDLRGKARQVSRLLAGRIAAAHQPRGVGCENMDHAPSQVAQNVTPFFLQ